jgi:hypothetical protein
MKMCTPILAGAPPPKSPGNQPTKDESSISKWNKDMIFYSRYLMDYVAYSCRNPPDSCFLHSCGIFFQGNHDSCSTVTFLEPPQETCLYGAYVGSYIGIKKELSISCVLQAPASWAPFTSQQDEPQTKPLRQYHHIISNKHYKRQQGRRQHSYWLCHPIPLQE